MNKSIQASIAHDSAEFFLQSRVSGLLGSGNATVSGLSWRIVCLTHAKALRSSALKKNVQPVRLTLLKMSGTQNTCLMDTC